MSKSETLLKRGTKMYNLYLGSNELRLIVAHGCYNVIEEWEGWRVVFQGDYSECTAYMNERYIEYQVSLID